MYIDLKNLSLIPSIKIEIQPGKESAVDFSTGQEPMVYKAKNGHLMVVRWCCYYEEVLFHAHPFIHSWSKITLQTKRT